MNETLDKKKWNNFWKLNKNSRFTQKSWSKIRMMNLLDGIVEKNMNILDAGCGSGFFSYYFISKKCNVYSVDYSDDALKITRKLTNNKSFAYLKEDLLSLEFGRKYAEKFDIIFSDGLLEHFSESNQKIIMDNFIKAKKKDGIITTFVPNKFSWWEIIRPIFMPGISEKPFIMKNLKKLHNKLEIIKTGGINVLPLAFSPDNFLGSKLGMILFIFAK